VDDDDDEDDDYPDLEYLIDSETSRELEDPFHILLLGSTFEKPKVTVRTRCHSRKTDVFFWNDTASIRVSGFALGSSQNTTPEEVCSSGVG